MTVHAGVDVEKEEHFFIAGGIVSSYNPLWKSIWQFFRKLEIILPEVLAIPLLSIYQKDA